MLLKLLIFISLCLFCEAATLTINSNETYEVNNTLNVSQININSGGTLLLEKDNKIKDSAKIVLNGGLIEMNSFSDTVGTLNIVSHSVIDLGGSSSILNFKDSHSVDWFGTLYIQNYASDDAIYFGNSGDSLTTNQLADIFWWDGFRTYNSTISSSGKIIRIVPEIDPIYGILILFLLLIVFTKFRKAWIFISKC